MSNTAALVAQAQAIYATFAGRDPFSACTGLARDGFVATIDALMVRDVARERASRGTPWGAFEKAPKRHTDQASYRDYYGWLCADELTATLAAEWATKHLQPRDSDGNLTINRVRKCSGGWLAVLGSRKIGD